jgi:hypothetical protein
MGAREVHAVGPPPTLSTLFLFVVSNTRNDGDSFAGNGTCKTLEVSH